MEFYEVIRQLQNRNRWIKEAFFQYKEDAEEFIKMRTKYLSEDRFPDNINLRFEIRTHKFHAPVARKKVKKTP